MIILKPLQFKHKYVNALMEIYAYYYWQDWNTTLSFILFLLLFFLYFYVFLYHFSLQIFINVNRMCIGLVSAD